MLAAHSKATAMAQIGNRSLGDPVQIEEEEPAIEATEDGGVRIRVIVRAEFALL